MNRKLAAFLVVLAAATVALAVPDVQTRYNGLTAAPTEVLVNGSGDSLTLLAVPLANRPVATRGNPTCYTRVDFSGALADTVVLHCVLWFKKGSTWTFLGSFKQTITAGNVIDTTGDNIGASLGIFDTGAASHVEVRAAAPSAGTVDLTVWCGAADSSGR